LESMTGYGSAEGISQLGSVSVEIRSVNYRFCDITLRLPKKLNAFEGRIRELIKSRFSRGRFDMSLRLDSDQSVGYRLEPDLEMARQYLAALRTIKAELRLRGEIGMDMISRAREIIVPVEEGQVAEAYWEEIKAIIARCLDDLKAMRRREGEELTTDLRNRLRSICGLLEEIKARAPVVVEHYRQRLGQQLQNMLKGTDVDPIRFNQEVALFAERSDISEETVRLASHLAQMERMIDGEAPVGRKLEFLLQEIHREANTISSKANDEAISHWVVEIKGELEKMREQIQNIE